VPPDGDVITVEPTEQLRQRNRQCDRVVALRHGEGTVTDLYQIEIQLKRTEDFQERMVSYWATLATRYRRAAHRIHQVVLWPNCSRPNWVCSWEVPWRPSW
jgi:hypothetical protein